MNTNHQSQAMIETKGIIIEPMASGATESDDKIIAEHWKKEWQQQSLSHFLVETGDANETAERNVDGCLKQDHEAITNDFLIRARENHLYQAFVARRNCKKEKNRTSPTILASICCQIWSGPVPIHVVDPSAFSLGAIWGLHVPRHSFVSDTEAKKVAVSLICAALSHLKNIHCQKALVLAFDGNSQTPYHEAGFKQGNMLTMVLARNGDFELGKARRLGDSSALPAEIEVGFEEDTVSYDELVCDHWRKMWLEVGMPDRALVPSFEQDTRQFISNARTKLAYKTIVARNTTTNTIVGSVSCQIWEGPFPQIVKPSFFQYGSIWAVYVDPTYRRRGIGRALMLSTLDYLEQIGCDTAILVAASDAGQRLYESIGFAPNCWNNSWLRSARRTRPFARVFSL